MPKWKIFFLSMFFLFSLFSYANTTSTSTSSVVKNESIDKNSRVNEIKNKAFDGISGVATKADIARKEELESRISDLRNQVNDNAGGEGSKELDTLVNEKMQIDKKINAVKIVIEKALKIENVYSMFWDFFAYSISYFKFAAQELFKIFLILEILGILIKKPNEIPISSFSKLMVQAGIVYFFIYNWLDVRREVLKIAQKIGYYVAHFGNTSFEGTFYYLPLQKVLDYYSEPLFANFNSFHWWQSLNPLALAYLAFSCVGLFTVFLICIEYIMALLEYYFVMSVAVLVLPFVIFSETKNIGGRILGFVVYQFFKVLIFFYFLHLGYNLVPNLGENSFLALYSDDKAAGLYPFCVYLILLAIIKMLLQKSSSFANMLIGGGSALGGRDATGILGAAVAGTVGGMAVTYKSLKALGAGKVISSAANEIKGMAGAARRINNNNKNKNNNGS